MPQVVGRGVNGDVRGEHVMLNRISLGTTTMEQIPAVILDVGEQSLLGQSFLREFEKVEIQNNKMILRQ
jgi:clan AA aspartic protease (TIGR02281 family)